MFDCSADPWRLRPQAAQPWQAFPRYATAPSCPRSRAPRTQSQARYSPTLFPLLRYAPRQLAPSQQIMKLPVRVRLPHQQCLEAPASCRISAPSHLIFDLEHRVLITTITPPDPPTEYQTSTDQQANAQRSPPRWFVPSARLLRRGRCCHHHLNNLHPSRRVSTLSYPKPRSRRSSDTLTRPGSKRDFISTCRSFSLLIDSYPVNAKTGDGQNRNSLALNNKRALAPEFREVTQH